MMGADRFSLAQCTILFVVAMLALLPVGAAEPDQLSAPQLTGHWVGLVSLAIFVLAYALVIAEENLHLRKSKPVIVAAGLIWALVAMAYAQQGDSATAAEAVRHNLLEFAEVFFFVLVAMTYINTMEELGVFLALKGWLVSRGFSLRAVFWLTGILAFFISPLADNLTTALLMSTVLVAVAGANSRFLAVACINVVVAANAGGAFCPFGDITTLMVWQKGVVKFHEFFHLFIPSLVNWLVPAALMAWAVPREHPRAAREAPAPSPAASLVMALFVITIALAVLGHHFLHLPPVMGMLTGLGLLQLCGYYLKIRTGRERSLPAENHGELGVELGGAAPLGSPAPRTDFDVFKVLERTEWDTLMFFYGIILCVGGLGTLGYLALASRVLYVDLGPTEANLLIGLLSAVIDNIPLMFAVLSMNPDMALGQWLLVTLTTGVGGSLLSIGSAAGVGVMGQARGAYTFFSHLKWSWAVALGYVASIWVHMHLNSNLFAQAIQ